MKRVSIPIATLPRINHILLAMFANKYEGELWCREGQKAFFLKRNSWGMAEAIKILLKIRKRSKGIIFIPGYFCNEALMPLRVQGLHLVFYPVTENLAPDWELINNMVSQYGRPDVFVLVHYFGFHSETIKALYFCKRVGAELLEDGAHILLPFGEIGIYGWATVFSPYKLLPLPKFGILVTSRMEINSDISKKWVDFNTCAWIGKRLIQSLLTRFNIPWRTKKVSAFESDPEIKIKESPNLPLLSLKLLNIIKSEIEKIKTIRRANYIKMMQTIESLDSTYVIPIFGQLPEDVCPYILPLRLHEDIVEDVYYSLNRAGVPAQTWPDLPPQVKENPLRYSTANKLRKSVLMIPIHQGLTSNHIDAIACNLRDSVKKGIG